MQSRKLCIALAFILFLSLQVFAGELRGRVISPSGQPLKKASVLVVGTPTKAETNEQGEFAVVVPAGTPDARLQIDAAGYLQLNVTIAVKEGSVIADIVMNPRTVVTEEVKVVAPRMDIPLEETAAATSVIPVEFIQTMQRAIAIDEVLISVPGVKIDNQANGERVHLSIRGQGILSERGIRGTQVMLDGIPLNDPSGFVSDVYDVDWASVREVSVLRGPVAFLYGGGSAAGVIDIRTREIGDQTHAELWSAGGSHGFYKAHNEVSGKINEHVGYLLTVARDAGDGYRQHTKFWGDNLSGKLNLKPTDHFHLNLLAIGTGFFSQNPEGLNIAQVAIDPRMPNPDALTYNEYQKTWRFTTGVTGDYSPNEHNRMAFTFYVRKTKYDEPVPSSVIHRRLTAPGGSAQYELLTGTESIKSQFSTGLDVDSQYTNEFRHPNMGAGVDGTAFVADQDVTQNRLGGFATERLSFGTKWTAFAGIRADHISNELTDHLQAGGLNLSGQRTFDRATGRVGVTFTPQHDTTLYASWGQGFMPPATEELYANPAALGGFNTTIEPATSQGFEFGIRGNATHHFVYDATFFRLDTEKDFERYRITGRPLETFYRNAGESRRYGLELSSRWMPINHLTVRGAYTYSNFQYTKYDSVTYGTNLVDHWLPNSPNHQLFVETMVDLPRELIVAVGTQAYSRAYIDATNATSIAGYGLLNARLSKGWKFRQLAGSIFVSGRNMLSKRYIAFTEPDPDGNSYQPGAEAEYFVGMHVRF